MKKLKSLPIGVLMAIMLLVANMGCAPTTYLRHLPNDYFQFNTATAPAISAHRGGGDYKGYPENCIESFAWLARQMPVIIECDISMTKDSMLVMMHDDTYNRTTNGSGRVGDSLYTYSKGLQLKDNFGNLTSFGIPSLSEVLQWGKNKVAFTLDVKRGVPYDKVVSMVQQYNAHRYAAVITYNANDAAKVHALDSNIMISVTIRNKDEYNRHSSLGIPDRCMIAFVGTREPDAEFLAWLHARGIRRILGTLGNLDKMAASRGDSLYKKWNKMGADIMSTDHPLEAWKALQ